MSNCLYYAYEEACRKMCLCSAGSEPLFTELRKATSGDGGAYAGVAPFLIESLESSIGMGTVLEAEMFLADWNSLGDMLKGAPTALAREIVRCCWMKFIIGLPDDGKDYIVLDLGINHAYYGKLSDAVWPQAAIRLRIRK